MKRVTKNNLLKLIKLKKEYMKNKDPEILTIINDFINNVINKDKKYFTKVKSYNFNEDELSLLI